MDKLNRPAAQGVQAGMPPDFPERIRLNFHHRYYRRKRYHLAICSSLLVFGLWLVSPVFITVFDRLAASSAGFSVFDSLTAAVLDMANLLLMVWNGAISFQNILLGSLSISVLMGMICMGSGAIWGIAYFIPPKAVQVGD